MIVATCAEHNIPYRVCGSLWEAIGGHIGLLKWLGSGEAAFGHVLDGELPDSDGCAM
jgi:hypothetical protein